MQEDSDYCCDSYEISTPSSLKRLRRVVRSNMYRWARKFPSILQRLLFAVADWKKVNGSRMRH